MRCAEYGTEDEQARGGRALVGEEDDGSPMVARPELVLVATRESIHNGDLRRLRKLDCTRPIDAAIALALAVQGATTEPPGSVYDTRGIIAI